MPVALVTGASRGIGAATAIELAAAGFDVAIHWHQSEQAARKVAAKVHSLGRKSLLLQADLAQPPSATTLVDETIAHFGQLDALVLNAGEYDRRQLAQLSPDHWQRSLQINLSSPAATAQAASQYLRKTGGSIVLTSSVAASRGSSHGPHYAAAKSALGGLARSLATELAPDVRVNVVSPGYIATDILADDTPEKTAARCMEVPLGRIGMPEDVAKVTAFLVSSDAAYITGQTIPVNGGLWYNS